jgi:NAD(P)-dependent dehydrogenase (short-subunit alcohol dehydrogenase family)
MLLSQLVLEPMRRLGGGAIVNVSSAAGIGNQGYGSPEYGAAKAGLIRFTSSLAGLWDSHRVRMTCLVPDWIGLPRAHEALAAMPPDERARVRPLVPPEDVVAVGLGLVREGRPGAVVEMRGGCPPHEQEPYSF